LLPRSAWPRKANSNGKIEEAAARNCASHWTSLIPFAGFVLYLVASDVKDVTTYRAALILEGDRVRGVDYSSIRRRRFCKAYIEKGWHENLIDPNLPTADIKQNRHQPLPDFQPTDLNDFLRKVCRMWQIELVFEEGLL
jgi:hypothetical protein